MYAALNYRNGQVHYLVHPKKNARQFIEFLRQMLEANKERFLVLVLDNASYHATRAVLDLLAEHDDHIFVVWLPTYSPELNAIEHVFRAIKHTHLPERRYTTQEALHGAVAAAFAEYEAGLIAQAAPQPGLAA